MKTIFFAFKRQPISKWIFLCHTLCLCLSNCTTLQPSNTNYHALYDVVVNFFLSTTHACWQSKMNHNKAFGTNSHQNTVRRKKIDIRPYTVYTLVHITLPWFRTFVHWMGNTMRKFTRFLLPFRNTIPSTATHSKQSHIHHWFAYKWLSNKFGQTTQSTCAFIVINFTLDCSYTHFRCQFYLYSMMKWSKNVNV